VPQGRSGQSTATDLTHEGVHEGQQHGTTHEGRAGCSSSGLIYIAAVQQAAQWVKEPQGLVLRQLTVHLHSATSRPHSRRTWTAPHMNAQGVQQASLLCNPLVQHPKFCDSCKRVCVLARIVTLSTSCAFLYKAAYQSSAITLAGIALQEHGNSACPQLHRCVSGQAQSHAVVYATAWPRLSAALQPHKAHHSFIHSCYTCGRSSYKQRLPIPDAANSPN
jgi:hypothetical protein